MAERSGGQAQHLPVADAPERASRMQAGAELLAEGRARFRVWAPARRHVELVLEEDGRVVQLTSERDGYWSVTVPDCSAGQRYRYRLDGEPALYPDPRSRYQPAGPHGPSALIDASAYAWRDHGWRGVSMPGQILYELHIGTFTEEGSYAAARARLPHLRALGVSLIELMPVAEFPGDFGWGYDGVCLFAPYHGYGAPDELRSFIDEAHSLGLGVILDVVYNHLGPDGNYLSAFSPRYFSPRVTEWGDALNFDGEDAREVRSFFCDNAAYWIEEFHFDGLRLDATQSIFDGSPVHILAELGERARAAAGARSIVLIAENEPQETKLVRARSEDGYALDALWNDDLHHSAVVALTAHNQAYYSDHLGRPQEFVSAVKHGFLYQGQRYAWQKKARGSSTRGLPRHAFVAFLENHDQVANSSSGRRLSSLCAPGKKRALTALLLLSPWTPLLFQGEEWASSRPFLYFAHHTGELAANVQRGRADFLGQFPSYAPASVAAALADPGAHQTLAACKLDWRELEQRVEARQTLALYRDLIALRRSPPFDAAQDAARVSVDGAVLSESAFALRFFMPDDDDRLLLVNLGRDLDLTPAPEPLLAPPFGSRWQLAFSSEELAYGGIGTPSYDPQQRGFSLLGEAALLFRAVPGGEP